MPDPICNFLTSCVPDLVLACVGQTLGLLGNVDGCDGLTDAVKARLMVNQDAHPALNHYNAQFLVAGPLFELSSTFTEI